MLLFAGLAFFLLLPLMKTTPTISLDVDWFYRRLAPRLVAWMEHDLRDLTVGIFAGSRDQIAAIVASLAHSHGPASLMARTLPTGRTVFWALVILAAFLVFNLT